MSISSPQTGGERRPTAKKAVAGGKPNTKPATAAGKTGAGPETSTGDETGGGSTPAGGAAKAAGATKAAGVTKAAGGKGAPAPGKGAPAGAKGTPAGGAAKAAAGKAAAGKGAPAGGGKGAPSWRGGDRPTGRPSSRPAGKGGPSGRAGRPPIAPVKVGKERHWGPIVLFTVVGLLAAGIIGFGAYEVHQNGLGWQAKADQISGIVDYRKKDPAMLSRDHKYGVISYKVNPPVGGNHNPNWQRCQGDVYTAQIPNENAVHSLEHGAVWITYRPDLAQSQVDILKSKVQGNDYMLMSPYPGLSSPISLQAWGFQLKVDNANDKRIGQFIQDLRQNAAMEPNTPCSTGTYVTGTGTTPYDLGAPSGSASASAPGMAKSS